MPPDTVFGIEYACDVDRVTTTFTEESTACLSLGQVESHAYSAFDDGTNFYDTADGEFVSWDDWPVGDGL